MLKRICQSRKLAALKTDGARLLYTWLLPNVDINGCFSGDEEVIKGQIFTRLKKSTKTINAYLADLDSVGLIIWYESNGDKFLHIPDFADKQPSLNPAKEAESAIPMPTPAQLQTLSGSTLPKVKESKVKIKEREVKSFVPPTLEQVKTYIQENPELSNIEPKDFWKGYNDGGWIDTQGKPVRNWKLKLRTRSNFARKESAGGQPFGKCYCGARGDFAGKDDTGQAYYRCDKHKQKKVYKPALPQELTNGVLKDMPGDTRSTSDKVNAQRKKLDRR